MNGTDNESRMVTGIAWYRPEQWERLREVSEDVENLESLMLGVYTVTV